MTSYLLKEIPEHLSSLAVEGVHKPGSLTQASGAWIHAAGCFVLEKGTHALNSHDQWVWLAVERGDIILTWDNHELELPAESTCFLPGGDKRFSRAATSAARSPRSRKPAASGLPWKAP